MTVKFKAPEQKDVPTVTLWLDVYESQALLRARIGDGMYQNLLRVCADDLSIVRVRLTDGHALAKIIGGNMAADRTEQSS